MEAQSIPEAQPEGTAVGREEPRVGAGFQHLLVCLDRSALAENALPLAAHLAELDGAAMTLLHVLEEGTNGPELRPPDALQWEIVRQEAGAYLAKLGQGLKERGLAIDCQVAEGSPALSAVAVADQLDADLLVLTTRGESGMGGADLWSLGGTAGKILALAKRAVLVFPAGQPARLPLRRVLVPLDGSLRSESVLATALHLALADGAELMVTHVVPDPIRTEVLSTPEDLELAQRLADHLAMRAEGYLERIRARLVAGGARVRAVVSRATDHREGLIALAASEQVDLIVVSAHGSVCNPRRRFGSVTTHLLSHSLAPVLVLQDLAHPSARDPAERQPRLPSRALDAASDLSS